MKVVRLFVITIIIIFFLLFTGLFIFITTFDFNRLKPTIIESVHMMTGRNLVMGDLSLEFSLSQGIFLHCRGITLSDDPLFSSREFVAIDNVFVGIDILKMVTQRKLIATRIIIDSPRINIVRNPEGVFNFQELGSNGQANGSMRAAGGGQGMLSLLLVKTLAVNKGIITYRDLGFPQVFELTIPEFDLRIDNFSFIDSFEVSLQMAVLSAQKNMESKAELSLRSLDGTLEIRNAWCKLEVSPLSLKKLNETMKLLGQPAFLEKLGGEITLSCERCLVSQGKPTFFSAGVTIRDGVVFVNETLCDFPLHITSLNLESRDISLSESFPVSVRAGILSNETNFSYEGNVQLNLEKRVFLFNKNRISFQLDKITPAVLTQIDEKFTGGGVSWAQNVRGDIEVNCEKAGYQGDTFVLKMIEGQLKNGQVQVTEQKTGNTITVSSLNGKVNAVSLDQPVNFSLSGRMIDDKQFFKMEGVGLVGPGRSSFELRDFLFEADVKGISKKSLLAAFPNQPSQILPENIRGKLKLTAKGKFSQGEEGVSFSTKGNLNEGMVTLGQLSKSIETIETDFTLTEKDFSLEAFSFQLGEGRVKAHGGIQDYQTTPQVSIDLLLSSLAIQDILPQKEGKAIIEGVLNGSCNLSGENLSVQGIRKTGEGRGQVMLTQGRLNHTNVLKQALDKITFFPNLSEVVLSFLSPKMREILRRDSTVINYAKCDASFAEGVVVLDPLSLEGDGFLLTSKGKIYPDNSLTIEGVLRISAELSKQMIQGVSQLAYLTDEQGQIVFPLKIGGNLNDLSFSVDSGYIASKIIRMQGRKQLQKLLDKALDLPDNEEAPSSSQESSPAEEPADSPEKVILDSILDRLLK